jgi:glycerate 2-kinase
LSAVKGGRLAQAAYPAQVVSLILSDVIGDPPGVIASGPTARDDSSFADALAVVDRYALRGRMPPRVIARLEQGAAGQLPETLKTGAPALAHTRNAIIGSIRLAMMAAEAELARRGFTPRVISDTIQGEARDAARMLAQAAREELGAMATGDRHALLYGGETTVTVHGMGLGGRNQELALAYALEIEGISGVTLLSAGTDGTDGPTDAAGAIVDGGTADKARQAGLDPAQYLDNNNSYAFFQRLDAATAAGSHIKTGPTGTNVMDIQIVLLSK